MSRYSMLPRRRQRCLSILLVCALILGYLYWFIGQKRSDTSWSLDDGPASETTSTQPQPTVSEPSSSITETQKRILLVSAFYPIAKSKHSDAEYADWLKRFLGHVSTDIYFFTTPEMEPLVRRARNALQPGTPDVSESTNPSRIPQLIINTTFHSPFSIPPLLPYKTKYEQMHAWDREQERHSAELYAIWNAKPWFVKEGLQNMQSGGEYDYAFWTDAGSFRHEHTYGMWPDAARVEEVWEAGFQLLMKQWKVLHDLTEGDDTGRDVIRKTEEARKAEVAGKEDLIFFPIYHLPGKTELDWKENLGPIDIDFSEGTFFGASPSAITWYTNVFYAYHDLYISTPPLAAAVAPHPHMPISNITSSSTPPFHFVGKDQTIINALLFLYPHRFISVISPSTLPPAPSISSSPQVKKWTWALKAFKTTASNKLWEKTRGKQGGICGDEWFYYQYFVARAQERQDMRRMWSSGLGWVEALLRGSGTGEKGEGEMRGEKGWGCPLAPVVTVEGVLRALFGARWKVPKGSVRV